MGKTDLGKWMITNGGEYSSDATYEQLTMVKYGNSTYITLKTVTGITPVDDKINYQLMAQGFDATALSAVQAEDTQGLCGEKGEIVTAQSLVDALADKVMNTVMAKIGTAALTGGMTDLSSGVNSLYSNLAQNPSAVADLFAEVSNTPGCKLAYCDLNTLNTPAKSDFGNVTGVAFINVKDTSYATIYFFVHGNANIFICNKSGGKFGGWRYLSPNPPVKEKGTYSNENFRGVHGLITSAGTQCLLSLPLLLSNTVNSVKVTAISCDIRTAPGGYLGGAGQIDLTKYLSSASIRKLQGLIEVTLTNSDGWGITNNTPVAGMCNLTYTLS